MREQGWGYLCRQEEDLVWDVPNATSNDSQSHSWEHIGIVSLPRNEGPAIFQSHALKRTSAGKDPSALEAGRKSRDGAWRWVSGSNGGLPFFILSHVLSTSTQQVLEAHLFL